MSDLAHVELVPWVDPSNRAVALVRVTGEIDLSNAGDVLEAISVAPAADATRVILDLSGTTYLDSTGIAMLFHLAERLTHRRQDLHVVVPPKARIRAVLTLTGADQVIPIHDSLTEASTAG